MTTCKWCDGVMRATVRGAVLCAHCDVPCPDKKCVKCATGKAR